MTVQRWLEAFEKLWNETGAFAAEGAKKLNSTCTKGCAHCCHLSTMASLADGMLVARQLLLDDSWRRDVVLLRAAAFATVDSAGAPLSPNDYFALRRPCVFLDGGACRVYAVRPLICRTHYAVSPPENCAPGATNPEVLTLDMQAPLARAWGYAAEMAPVMGPLPTMVLSGLAVLLHDANRTADLRWLEKQLRGVPSPEPWVEKTRGQSAIPPARES